MSTRGDGHKRQASLRRKVACNTCARERALKRVWVVRNVKLVGRWRLETLQAVPRHVLDDQQGAVGQQHKVLQTAGYDGVVCALDHALQRSALSRREGKIERIVTIGTLKHASLVWHALGPVCWWDMKRLLNAALVEVDGCSCWLVAKGRVTESIPEKGALVRDVVGVETGVDLESGVEDVVVEIAHDVLRSWVDCIKRAGWRRERPGWRVLKIGAKVVCVVAHSVCAIPHVCNEARVQGKDG